MHPIYHTEAFVLESKNLKEDSKYYLLFTKDLGLIYASAGGVRKISSKLRFVLQDFSFIKVDLIKSKDFWKITSASKTENDFSAFLNKEQLSVLSKIFSLLKKLLIFSEKNEKLFMDLFEGLKLLSKSKKENLSLVEIFVVLKILHHLGYLSEVDGMKEIAFSSFEEEALFKIKEKRQSLIFKINQAIRESHM